MHYSFAPMEGVTSCVFRRTHAAFFPGVDRYCAPFLAPDGAGRCKTGGWRDLLPENNPAALPLPQILCNSQEAFLSVARELEAMGYGEVNLNVGCPSGTVVPKHKGAGMLQDLASLDAFLADVFSRCALRVSVKTRLGLHDSAEFPAILDVYRRYPLSELIIHARSRDGMYQSRPDLDAFAGAFSVCPFPVCYNGSVEDGSSLEAVRRAAPGLERVMIGRAAAGDPAVFRVLRGGAPLTLEELRAFLKEYEAALLASGLSEYFTLGRLKELWFYLQARFPAGGRTVRRLQTARTLAAYHEAESALFQSGAFDARAQDASGR